MKKFLIIIFLNFFYVNFAHAGFEGSGKITLSETVVKYFLEYLDTKDHNNNAGAERHGRGWYFFVAESGEEFGYVYCPSGQQCVVDQIPVNKACKKMLKNILKDQKNVICLLSKELLNGVDKKFVFQKEHPQAK